MRKAPRLLLALLLLGGVHVAVATPALACSCVSAPDTSKYVEWAPEVFVGEVINWAPPPQQASMTSLDPAIWTFAVTEVYKGEVAATQDVASAVSGASCGLEFPHSGKYLIYTQAKGSEPPARHVPGPVLYAGLCAGSRAVGDAPIPADLGDPKPPIPGVRAADLPKTPTPQPSISQSPSPATPEPSVTESPDAAAPRSAPATGADWATVASWSTGASFLAFAAFVFIRRAAIKRQ